MATKNNPGKYDCYENAHPDEPMFVLLGRDPDAPSLVERWAMVRESHGESKEKVAEARECAESMRLWLKQIGKTDRPVTGIINEMQEQLVHARAEIRALRECLSRIEGIIEDRLSDPV